MKWSRWWMFLPELVLGAGLTFFLVDEPDAATSALKSPKAIALMAVTGVVWIAGRLLLARFVPWRVVTTAVFGVAAVGILAVVVAPAYDDDMVVESFPMAAEPDAEAAPDTPTPNTPRDSTGAPSSEPPGTSVAAPDDDAATTTPKSTPSPAAAPTTTVPVVTTTTTTAPPPTTTTVSAAPVLLRTAPFAGIDHRAAGTVALYRAPDGRLVVGLEEIDIQPGPDYDVYVVPGADRDDPDGGTRLDDLRGNQGTQYYEVPPEVDVATGEWTVLVWCQTFAVPVANATPA